MGGAAISKTLRSSGGTHPSLACEKGCPRQLSVNAGQLGRTYLPEIRPRAVLGTATGRQHDFGGGYTAGLPEGIGGFTFFWTGGPDTASGHTAGHWERRDFRI